MNCNATAFKEQGPDRTSLIDRPVERVLRRLRELGREPRRNGGGWVARCPVPDHGKGRGDRNPSLTVNEGTDSRALIKCQAGCPTERVLDSLGLTWRDLFPRPVRHGRSRTRRRRVLTVEELAQAKGLPIPFVRRFCEQAEQGVRIVYYTETGERAPRHHVRLSLDKQGGKPRFVWEPKGGPNPIPYGLNCLEDARRAGYLVLVEGESDCWTLWYHRFPALGLPGSSMWKGIAPEHLAGIDRVYIWREPDSGGQHFVEGIARRLAEIGWDGQTFVIEVDGAKDPNELHQRDPESFPIKFQDALNQAQRLIDVPAAHPSRESSDTDNLPFIAVNNRHLREIEDDAVAALLARNVPPTLFEYGGVLTRVRSHPNGVLQPEPLSVAALRSILDRAANFVIASEGETSPARPPRDVVEGILANHVDQFPHLDAIRSSPVFVRPGRLLAVDGYDEATGILIHLNGLDGIRTDMPLNEALTWLLDELLGDFPFVDDGSRAHALSLLLQPFVRPLIEGPTPIFVIDAPTPGSGKGLLADIACLVALGREPRKMSINPSDPAEHEKRITALLLDGEEWVLLDNLVGLFDSSAFAALLTSTVWSGRLLGRSKSVALPNVATWVATGNNVQLSDELARRTIPIRLDPGVERPEYRTGFRHPDLRAWVRKNRPALVSACLSLIQAWIDAGQPLGEKLLGSFEAWCRVMGGILTVAGVPGFLEGRERLYSDADQQTAEWKALCEAWWERYGDHPITAKDIFLVAKERRLLLDLWGGRTDLGAQQRIGRTLASLRDRVFGRFRIRSAGRDSVTGNAAYRLEPISVPNAINAGETPDAGQSRNPLGTTVRQDAGGVSGVSGVLVEPIDATRPTHDILNADEHRNARTIQKTPETPVTHAGNRENHVSHGLVGGSSAGVCPSKHYQNTPKHPEPLTVLGATAVVRVETEEEWEEGDL